MTERSYLWDGTATGDASLAPYNAQEFNLWMFSQFLSNNLTESYVVPGYLNDLWVRGSDTQHAVTVKAGAACFNNYLYILDEDVTLPIERLQGAYYRRDLVVLRADLNNNKVRLAVVQGSYTTSQYPAEPALTQTAATYEVALASVYVVGDTAGYGYTGSVADKFVHDRRKFIYNLFQRKNYQGGSPNLLRNSEWLATPDVTGSHPQPPEWVGLPISGINMFVMTEGSGRDYGMIPAGSNTTTGQWIDVRGQVFTVKVSIEDVNTTFGAQVGLQAYRTNGEESSLSNIHEIFLPTPAGGRHTVQFTTKFPESDIAKLFIYIRDNTGSIYSQVLVQPGYHVGHYRQIQEVVMFDLALPDASWTATAKSSGTTTIDLAASFGPVIRNYTKAVILRLRGRDSGSAAAANCRLQALGYAAPFNSTYGSLEITGVTNDVWRETTAIVPVDQIYWGTGTAGAQFRLVVVASGAGTFDATVEIVGVIL